MPRRFVADLSDGETIEEIFLLADKQLRANRNADLFLLAQLKDKTGMISGLMWNVSEDSTNHIEQGHYVKVRGKAQLYQGNLQMILTHIDTVPEAVVDVEDFQTVLSRDAGELQNRLHEILRGIKTVPLRQLTECFLSDDEIMQAFVLAPAGVKAHHAYHGGLLEHVVNLLEVAVRIGDLYPKIDSDLLLVGIFLHDLGKIRELEFETAFLYSDEGQLLGHLIIAVEILTEKILELEQKEGMQFPEETALRLKHMILSHHGNYEYGSPKLPMTPEAIALHHLDNLDAKVNEFTQMIESDPNRSSNWTPFNNRIERKLFKGSHDLVDNS